MGTFVFRWPHKAIEHVYVTGTFDNWSKSVKLDKVDDVFLKEVALSSTEERILYKFVVDNQWVVDQDAPQDVDGYGNANNVLRPAQLGALAPIDESESATSTEDVEHSKSSAKGKQSEEIQRPHQNFAKKQIPEDFDNQDWKLVNHILGSLHVPDDVDSLVAEGDADDDTDNDQDTIKSFQLHIPLSTGSPSSSAAQVSTTTNSQPSNYYGSTIISDSARAVVGNVLIEKHDHHYPPPNALPNIDSEPEQAQAFIAAVFQAASQYNIPMPNAPTRKDPGSIAQWVQGVYEAHMCATSIADGQTATVEGSIGTSGLVLVGSDLSDDEESLQPTTSQPRQKGQPATSTDVNGKLNKPEVFREGSDGTSEGSSSRHREVSADFYPQAARDYEPALSGLEQPHAHSFRQELLDQLAVQNDLSSFHANYDAANPSLRERLSRFFVIRRSRSPSDKVSQSRSAGNKSIPKGTQNVARTTLTPQLRNNKPPSYAGIPDNIMADVLKRADALLSPPIESEPKLSPSPAPTGALNVTAKSQTSVKGTKKLKVGDVLVVVHDFQARSPDELTLVRGEHIELMELDDGFGDGWYLGRRQTSGIEGDVGLFPNVYAVKDPRRVAVSKMPVKKTVEAIFDYEPPSDKQSAQLRFYKGERLHVIGREEDTAWYEARNPLRPNIRGLVPVECVKDVLERSKIITGQTRADNKIWITP